MGWMPGWSRLQRALTKKGSKMHMKSLPSSSCTGAPALIVPRAPHTSGAFLDKVYGVREGIVSLEELYPELLATLMGTLQSQDQVPTRPGRMGASHMCLPSLVSLT